MALTVDQKLTLLESLQKIDSKLDRIKTLRGDLPEEVADLEDEIVGYEVRLTKHEADIDALNKEISEKKDGIKKAEALTAKYKEQQMNVRNNREYDAITKEMELQELEVQICDKRIKEARFNIDSKQEEIASTTATLEGRRIDLQNKKKELTELISESEDEEAKLLESREKSIKKMEDRIYESYQKLRINARNGLAVVSVKRDACGGCFNSVPPQRQYDIRERKKLMVCEHCGRILADVEVIVEEDLPKKKTSRKKAVESK
jgi:uncharacterized protein